MSPLPLPSLSPAQQSPEPEFLLTNISLCQFCASTTIPKPSLYHFCLLCSCSRHYEQQLHQLVLLFMWRRVKNLQIPASSIPYFFALRGYYHQLINEQGILLLPRADVARIAAAYRHYSAITRRPAPAPWVSDPNYYHSMFINTDDILYEILADLMALVGWYGVEIW